MDDGQRPASSAGAATDPDAVDTVGISSPGAGRLAPAEIGEMVSRYVVLAEVGVGGMGRVLRAYDPKLQREVALKEVRLPEPGSAANLAPTADRERHLVIEARAMAKLSHPNVVAVYDVEEAGPGGAVVLVMEYVPGRSLKEWLADGDRGWREVLAHFIRAGRGLAAAHDAGLLHRDFKPANVLVGDAGEVKVTDFGLAKAVGHRSEGLVSAEHLDDSAAAVTEAGVIAGTPRYMAPEQHEGRELDAAADQYSFCVALWEALHGEPPFRGPDLAELKRKGPPAWTLGTVPRAVGDAIVKGLRPDPRERWTSVDALLEALARDPVRRRRRWIAGVSAVATVGFGVAGFGSWSQARAQRCSGAEQHLAGVWNEERRARVAAGFAALDGAYAEEVGRRTVRELDAYADDWAQMHTEACEATAVRGEQSAAVLDLRMACLHRAQVDLGAAVDVLADPDAGVARHAHEVVGALRPLSGCADVEALRSDVEPPRPDEVAAVETGRARLAEAAALRQAGRYQDARATLAAAREVLSGVSYRPVQAELALEAGSIHDVLGEYDEAVAELERALGEASRARQFDAMLDASLALLYVVGVRQKKESVSTYVPFVRGLARRDSDASALHSHLASIFRVRGEYEDAEREAREALSILERSDSSTPLALAELRHNLANVMNDRGEYGDAEREHRRALAVFEQELGPDHPKVASARNGLAIALDLGGDEDEALRQLRQCAATMERALGPEHPEVADIHNNMVAILYAQGEYQQAEAEARRALEIWAKSLGTDHPHVAMSRNNLANILRALGKDAEAETQIRTAIEDLERALGEGHPAVAMARSNLANLFDERGDREAAEAEHRRALALREAALGPEHPDVAASHNNLAIALEGQGKYAEAEAEHRVALELWTKQLGPDHPDVADSTSALARVRLERGAPDDALTLAERAWSLQQTGEDVPAASLATTAFVLARALWETGGDRARARELAERARTEFARSGAGHESDVANVETWLRTH